MDAAYYASGQMEDRSMAAEKKCRNSVFCVLFFGMFVFGTICGALLLRILALSDAAWIKAYCAALAAASRKVSFGALLLWSVPLMLVWLVGWATSCQRALLAMIVFRGLATAFSFSAFWLAGVGAFSLLPGELVRLALYYLICRRVWCCEKLFCFM